MTVRPVKQELRERMLFRVAAGFGLWTLAFHAVVALGGDLHALLVAGPTTVGVGLLVERRLAPASRASTPVSSRVTTPPWVRGVVTASALVVAALLPGSLLPPTALWWGLVLGLLAGAAVAVAATERGEAASPSPSGSSRRLWLLAAGSAAFALVLHKPETDDGFFVALAARAIDDPTAALAAVNPVLGIPDMPIHLAVYKVQSLPYLAAAVSWVTGLPAIGVFHLLIGPVVAAALPLAHAVLYRRLLPERWLRATVLTLGFMILFSSVAQGGDAFTQPWIGNTIFLTVLSPLLAAAALDLARDPTAPHFFRVALLQVAAVGASSVALWAAPVIVSLFGLAGLVGTSPRLRAAGLGLLSCAYPVAVGLALRRVVMSGPAMAGVGAPQPLPDVTQAGAAALGSGSGLALVWLAMACAWVWQRRSLARDVALVVPGVFAVTLYNPYLSEAVATLLTSRWLYERVFWGLPFPVLAVLLAHGLLESYRPRAWARALLVAALIVGGAAGTLVTGFVRHGWGNLSILGFPPGLKVPHPEYDVARRLHAILGPGRTVLAVRWVGLWLPTFNDPSYPLASKRQYLDSLMYAGRREEYVRRLLVSAVVGGELDRWHPFPEPIPDPTAYFREGLRELRPDAVCLSPQVDDRRGMRSALRSAGYRHRETFAGHEIWLRSGFVPPGDPQGPGPG